MSGQEKGWAGGLSSLRGKHGEGRAERGWKWGKRDWKWGERTERGLKGLEMTGKKGWTRERDTGGREREKGWK